MMATWFRHAKVQIPLMRLRSRVSELWRFAFRILGKFKPLTAAEMAVVEAERVPFKGDIPLGAGDEHHQNRLVYARPREPVETVKDLIFTPAGAGWAKGRLFERYSACKPGLRLLAAPPRPAREIDEAYVVQAGYFASFGDWFSEYIAPLSRAGDIKAPVLLPAKVSKRAYVDRYAKAANIAFEPIEAPVLIRNAHVVRQLRVIRYWRPEDAIALRRLLKASPVAPRPSSLLYLSRLGEKSEIAERGYPSEIVEKIVKARGGRVLRTGDATLNDYIAAAEDAETILYDHGSAAYNMIYWQPRRAIEFVSDDWWMNSFLFISDSIGVKDYTIIRGDLPGVAERLEAALDAPFITESS